MPWTFIHVSINLSLSFIFIFPTRETLIYILLHELSFHFVVHILVNGIGSHFLQVTRVPVLEGRVLAPAPTYLKQGWGCHYCTLPYLKLVQVHKTFVMELGDVGCRGDRVPVFWGRLGMPKDQFCTRYPCFGDAWGRLGTSFVCALPVLYK